MKKFFALILALCLLVPVLSLAEEEAEVYSWEDVRESAEAAGGKFVQLAEVPYEFWLADSVEAVSAYITDSYALYGGFVFDASPYIPDAEEGYEYVGTVNFNLYQTNPDIMRNNTFEEYMNRGRYPLTRCTVNGITAFRNAPGQDGRSKFIHYYFPLEDEKYMYMLIPCFVEKTQDGKTVDTIWFDADSEYFTVLIRNLVCSVRPVE